MLKFNINRVLFILACQSIVRNFGSAADQDQHKSVRWRGGEVRRGIDGGISCAACSVLLGMAEQLGDIHNKTVVSGLDILCSYLPPDYDSKCSLFIRVYQFSVNNLGKSHKLDISCVLII